MDRENKIPGWLYTTAFEENDYKNVRDEDKVTIVDPNSGDKPTIRSATAYLFVNEKKGESSTEKDYVVGLFWTDSTAQEDIFKKKYPSEDEARKHYEDLKSHIHGIHNMLDTSPEKALEMAKELFEKEKLISDSDTSADTGQGGKSMSSLHQEFVPGWEVVKKDNTLVVAFSYDYLRDALRKFPVVLEEPSQKPETVYSTASKLHCGLNNYVVSRWGKTLTAEGNILRNVVRVERRDENEQVRLTYANVSSGDFNIICSSLTPDQRQYGISYDSVTGKWLKTSKAIIQNLFFDTVEEMTEYQNKSKGDKATDKPKTELKDTPKDEIPESISFEELMDKEDDTDPEASPAESLKQDLESSVDATHPLTHPALASLDVIAKINPSDMKEGDTVIYMSEGKALEGVVKAVHANGIDLQVGEELHKGLEEEAEGISYFMTPKEHRALKEREVAHRKQEADRKRRDGKEWSHEPSAEPAKEVDESLSEEDKEKEELKLEREQESGEAGVTDEDLGETVDENALAEEIASSLRPISSLDITAGIKQWIEWPEGLPTAWMKRIYEGLLENFRSTPLTQQGEATERGYAGLRTEIKAIDEKRQRSEDARQHILGLRKRAEELQTEIDDLKKEIEASSDEKKAEAEKKLKYAQKQKQQREVELQAARSDFKRKMINPQAFKEALTSTFLKYAPLSSAPKALIEPRDGADVAKGSKELRKLIQEEKQLTEKLKAAQQVPLQVARAIEEKEGALWSFFQSMPDYSDDKVAAQAIEEKLLKIDELFADYLEFHGEQATAIAIKKFQDTIAKLEAERAEKLKGAKLPEAEAQKVNGLVAEINELQNKLGAEDTWKEVRELEKQLAALDKAKAKMQEDIGVVASLDAYISKGE